MQKFSISLHFMAILNMLPAVNAFIRNVTCRSPTSCLSMEISHNTGQYAKIKIEMRHSGACQAFQFMSELAESRPAVISGRNAGDWLWGVFDRAGHKIIYLSELCSLEETRWRKWVGRWWTPTPTADSWLCKGWELCMTTNAYGRKQSPLLELGVLAVWQLRC